MATDSRAYGTSMFPPLTVRPDVGQNIVAYVRASGVQDGDTQFIASRLVTSLNTALRYCRANMNDIVVVLPGHTETISSADFMDNLVAGCSIVGLGVGSDRPTFTWSAAAATWLVDQANVYHENLVFKMAGDGGGTALTVAAAMTVSADGAYFKKCEFETSIDADELAAIGLTITGADNVTLDGCYVYGLSDGTGVTTAISVVDTNRLTIVDTDIYASTSAVGVGVLDFATTLSALVRVENCSFVNKKAASTAGASDTVGSSTGTFKRCGFGTLGAGLVGIGGSHAFQLFGCYSANTTGENGAATTPVST